MIGNLILVSEEVNNALQNRSFAEKKSVLQNAGVPLDPVLAIAEAWDGPKIHERTRSLAALIFTAEA
jgi:crotonobetainyl-CoA:carnitine CoA-transferase CaiB-like acyl-CoA transferase